MATDLAVTVEDKPGALAGMGEAIGAAGINIGGVCGAATPGASVVHLLVDDAAAAPGGARGRRVHVGRGTRGRRASTSRTVPACSARSPASSPTPASTSSSCTWPRAPAW